MLHKSISLFVILFVVSVLTFAGEKDKKVSGVITGAHCAANGMACPTSHDLHRSELPGIFTKDGKFYTLANVPQSFLAQWPSSDVTVEGTVYEKSNNIYAAKISVGNGDKLKTVFEEGNIVDAMGHKEKLTTAVELDGKWYCSGCSTMHDKAEEK
ncbi:MAG: hypothetical protein EPO24_02170 [Bacteroidetes bacterium]|nr:MAG: hypothetical protein EPO24_02170 [Bacteroidota bacterium]